MDEHAQLQSAVDAAESEARAGRWPQALARYRKILRARLDRFDDLPRAGPFLTSADAFIIERLADLSVPTGHPEQAAKLFKALVLVLRQAGNGFMADFVALKVLHLAISDGDRPSIESALAGLFGTIGPFDQIAFDSAGFADFERRCQWLQVNSGDRALFFAHFFLESGRLLAWLGQYSEAQAALHRSLHHAGSTEPSVFENLNASVCLELASGLLACGEVPTARKRLSAVHNTSAHPGHIERYHELTAQEALLTGDLGRAVEAFNTVRALCLQQGFAAAAASTALNLAHILVLLNRTVEAEQLISEAQTSADALENGSLSERSKRLAYLVAARRRSGFAGVPTAPSNAELWGEAEPARKVEVREEGPFELGAAGGANLIERLTDYTLGFYYQIEHNNLEEATAWLAQMDEVFGPSDSPLVTLRLDLLRAMLDYYQGEYHAAAVRLDDVRHEFRQRGLRHDLWQANCFRLWCQARLGEAAEQHTSLLDETQDLLKAMSRSLPEEERAVFELNKWSEDEVLLAARIDTLAAAFKSAQQLSWLKRLQAYLRALWELDDLVAALDQRRAALMSSTKPPRRLAWWHRLFFHSKRSLTLSFLVLPDRTFVVREGFLRFDFVVAPVTRLRLREIVRGWHESVAAGPAHTPEALRCAAELSAHLGLASLIASGRPLRQLRVIPDDSLHGFPFAALRQYGRFLAEDCALVCDSSHVPHQASSAEPSGRRALVAAMSLPSDGFPELPGVRREADLVARRFAESGLQVKQLLDTQATRAALCLELQCVGVAHIACHGVFARDDMRRTGLVFAPGMPTGLLHLMDIVALSLASLRHITLSSCWSADNYLLPGRHVFSLPQFLRRAGVGSILASLWPVDDATAAAFHEHFYEQCLHHTPVEALNLTQVAFLRRTIQPFGQPADDPYYWAGFTLYGAPCSRSAVLT